MIYIGSEKWTSKKGTVGYNLYFMEEVKDGVGAKYHMLFKNGFRTIPSTDEDHYYNVFKDIPLKTQIDELYYNSNGYVTGCKIHKV